MKNNITEKRKSEFLPHLIIVGAFCFLLSQTWFRWGDLIIDTGHELWLPGELLKGKVLYNDLPSFYGFLPPYLIAGLYKIFGISINTLVYTGIAVTLIVSFTVYRIARLFLDQGFATLLVINFLFILAFGNYNTVGIFNFILPYAFAATFFMMFTALSLYFFLKFVFSGNRKNLLTWTTFLTMAFLCRPESTLVVWPAFLLSGSILAVRQPKAEPFKIFAYLLSPLLLTALCYGLFFLVTHTFFAFREIFIGGIKVIAATPASRLWAGIDNIPANLLQISSSFLLHIAILLGLALVCRIIYLSGDGTPATKTIIPIAAAFLFFVWLKQYSLYELQYHCVILVLFSGLVAYFLQSLKPNTQKRSLALLTLFLTSFLITSRIFLATSHYWYGFSLLTMPLICYYIFFGDLLKTTLENRFRIPDGLLSVAIAGFLILMIIPFWEQSSYNYRYHNKLVNTSKGELYSNNDAQTDIFCKTVDYLKKNTPKTGTLIVLPEGLAINFFTGRTNPLKCYNCLPEYVKIFGEDKIISDIKAAKIGYIVILCRDTSLFGPTSFGVDYAKKIQKWIDNNYVPIKQFGAKPYASKALGMLILKRKS